MTTATRPRPAMDAVSPSEAFSPRSEAGGGSSATAGWWGAVAVASLVGVPCGFVLSYAALLPFFIGVFFFALFGLILGALAYRIGAPGKPYPKARIIVGTTLIIFITFAASLLKEGRDFPSDMATRALKNTRSIGGLTPVEFRSQVESDVREFLRKEYRPGGTLGYLRWTLTSGRISKRTFDWMERDLVFAQARYLFALRLAISLGLLAFGVASQTWTMRRATSESR